MLIGIRWRLTIEGRGRRGRYHLLHRRTGHLEPSTGVISDVLSIELPPRQKLVRPDVVSRDKAIEVRIRSGLDLDHSAIRPSGQQLCFVGFGQSIPRRKSKCALNDHCTEVIDGGSCPGISLFGAYNGMLAFGKCDTATVQPLYPNNTQQRPVTRAVPAGVGGIEDRGLPMPYENLLTAAMWILTQY
jgi:hypothetical protein